MSRSAYLDHVKLALITLVVIGHTLSPLAADCPQVLTAWKLIYTFHMPLFIFLNGYFSSLKKNPAEKCMRFFLIYLGMQVLTYFCLLMFRFDSLSFHLLTPSFGLWYLMGLIMWTLALPLTRRVRPGVLMPCAIILALAAGYVEEIGPFLAFSRILCFFPFFLLGFYAKKQDLSQIRSRLNHPIWKLAATAFLCLLTFCLIRFDSYLPQGLFLAKTAYSKTLLANPGPAWLYRLGLYGVSCLAGLSFMLLVPQKRGRFSAFGQRTMAVYLGHLLLLDLFKDRIPDLAQILPVPILVSIAIGTALLLCHPLFSVPVNYLMQLPLLPTPVRIADLRPAPLLKKLRHRRYWMFLRRHSFARAK